MSVKGRVREVVVVYGGCQGDMREKVITAEEVLGELGRVVPR